MRTLTLIVCPKWGQGEHNIPAQCGNRECGAALAMSPSAAALAENTEGGAVILCMPCARRFAPQAYGVPVPGERAKLSPEVAAIAASLPLGLWPV